MHILGIDYGKKRIGLAWIDTNLGVVLPYGIIEKNGIKEKVNELASLIKKENIEKAVIGLPLGLDGKENENTEKVHEFVKILKENTNIPIEFVDERFTTSEANKMEGEASADEKAAILILQAYLDKTK